MSVHLDASSSTRSTSWHWRRSGRRRQWEVSEAGPDRAVVSPTDGTTFHLSIERVAHPKLGQEPIHLDLTTSSLADQVDSVATLLALGAPPDRHRPGPRRRPRGARRSGGQRVLHHRTDQRFLAGCGRLGAVNCDGTRRLGVFWSEAFGLPWCGSDEETAIRVPGTSESMIT
ncbi:MAG: VOC family protein [Ilumatobacteraceae bacterium]